MSSTRRRARLVQDLAATRDLCQDSYTRLRLQRAIDLQAERMAQAQQRLQIAWELRYVWTITVIVWIGSAVLVLLGLVGYRVPTWATLLLYLGIPIQWVALYLMNRGLDRKNAAKKGNPALMQSSPEQQAPSE